MPDYYCYGVKVTDHGETGSRPNYRWAAAVNGIEIKAQSMREMRVKLDWEMRQKQKTISLFEALEKQVLDEASDCIARHADIRRKLDSWRA